MAFQEIRAQVGSPASHSQALWLGKQQAELLAGVNAPSCGAHIRCGLEAKNQFGSDPHRQVLQPLGDNFEKAQGDFFFT